MIILYSDGGGQKGRDAAGACIIDDSETGERTKLVMYLGEGTNNEAEISAGLLGFAALRKKYGSKPVPLKWVSDSEYTLKSATSYIFNWQRNGWKTASKSAVKNQGLWRTYLEVRGKFKIEPEHVKGHSGHPENEACDSASTWAQQNGEDLIEDSGESLITGVGPGDTWTLVDGRAFLDSARVNEDKSSADILKKAISGELTSISYSNFKIPTPLEELEELLKADKLEGDELKQARKIVRKLKKG